MLVSKSDIGATALILASTAASYAAMKSRLPAATLKTQTLIVGASGMTPIIGNKIMGDKEYQIGWKEKGVFFLPLVALAAGSAYNKIPLKTALFTTGVWGIIFAVIGMAHYIRTACEVVSEELKDTRERLEADTLDKAVFLLKYTKGTTLGVGLTLEKDVVERVVKEKAFDKALEAKLAKIYYNVALDPDNKRKIAIRLWDITSNQKLMGGYAKSLVDKYERSQETVEAWIDEMEFSQPNKKGQLKDQIAAAALAKKMKK